eukprot:894093-Amphidinium_carterae.1
MVLKPVLDIVPPLTSRSRFSLLQKHTSLIQMCSIVHATDWAWVAIARAFIESLEAGHKRQVTIVQLAA